MSRNHILNHPLVSLDVQERHSGVAHLNFSDLLFHFVNFKDLVEEVHVQTSMVRFYQEEAHFFTEYGQIVL